MIDFEKQISDAEPPAASLERIVALAQHMRSLQSSVERAAEELEDLKGQLRQVEEVDLPELMRELGVSLMRLDDGAQIEVADEVACAISEANRRAAHEWLAARGYDGIIKTEVAVQFGRGEYAIAQRLAKEIGGAVTEKIHPQTLKSFVKERLAAGEKVPFDLFGVHPYSKAKIRSKK